MIDYLLEDLPEYISRGDMISDVLSGAGSVDILPGRPDIQATQSDWDRGDKFDPDLPFDINAFSRVDKFDGLEVGQHIIDGELDSRSKSDSNSSSEEK